MNLNILFSIFTIYLLKLCTGNDLSTFIELIEYDYEDQCANIGTSCKEFLTKDSTDLYTFYSSMIDKIDADESFARFQREQATQLSSYDIDIEDRKIQLLTKIGDNLLPDNEISKIIDLKTDTEKLLLTTSIPCFNNDTSGNLFYYDVLNILATSNNVNELEYVWSSWNTKFQNNENKLAENVKLIASSAKANGMSDVESYWDLLTEYTNSFRRMKTLWEKIEPLYLKLHKFVKDRLVYNKYMSEDTEDIPIYLLGTSHGENWINLADKILPDPQIYDKILNAIQEKNIGGKNAFISAQLLTNNVGLNDYNEQFWENSLFDSKCPTHILNFCQNGNIEVITCNATSIPNFIEANGIGFHIAHSQLLGDDANHLSFIIRNPNRYSALHEAVKEMGSLLSMHPSNLHSQELVYLHEYEVFSEKYHANQTLLLLNALRILPKLAYYVSADDWRLQILENDTSDVDWWDVRKQYQRVSGNGNTSDYLYDLDVVQNKPYISKFMGTILQFQMLEYFKLENEDEKQDIIEKLKENSNFIDLLKSGYSEEWPFLTDKYLRIEEVDANALLTYFQPLKEYLDNAPLKKNTVKPIEITTTSTTPITTTMEAVTDILITNETSTSEATNLEDSLPDSITEKNNGKLSTSNIYIMIGSGILIICAIIGIITIMRLRTKSEKKQVRNNRRFEA